MNRRGAKKPKPKADDATVEARIVEVLRMVLDGAESWDIREYVREKEAAKEPPWIVPDGFNGLCEDTIREYMRRANAEIGKAARGETREQIVDWHLEARRRLYSQCVNGGDYANARGVLKDLAELLGLYPGKDLNLKGSVQVEVAEHVVRTRAEARAALAAVAEANGLPGFNGHGEGVRGGTG